MKFTIELEDEKLMKIIGDHVKQKVAELSSQAIAAEVNQILKIKFGRVDDKAIQEAVTLAARDHVASAYPTDQYASGKIKAVMSEAAISLIKQVR